MGVKELVQRFKEKKEQIAVRSRERREIAKAENEADRYSKRTAISEARQLRRESRAKQIKEKYGTYKPLSQRVTESVKGFQDARAKRVETQRRTQPQRTARKPINNLFGGNNLLSSNSVTTGQSPGGVNFGFSGPNLGSGGLSRDIVTGKPLKRK